MPSGYKVGGTDLDSLFAPRAGSTPAANTGYQVGGVDLADRYHASTGGDTIGSNTGYQVGGTDLRSIFRDISYTPPSPPSITGGSVTNPYYCYSANDSVSLNVTATGSSLSYQWYKNGSAISGATSSTYSFTVSSSSSSTADAGNYRVTVSNSSGSDSADTDIAILNVSLEGPADVTAGDFSHPSDKWEYAVYSSVRLARVQFQIQDHGNPANWTNFASGDPPVYQYGGTVQWVNGLGNPSISYDPGTYQFYFQADNANGDNRRQNKDVMVH